MWFMDDPKDDIGKDIHIDEARCHQGHRSDTVPARYSLFPKYIDFQKTSSFSFERDFTQYLVSEKAEKENIQEKLSTQKNAYAKILL